MVALMVPPVRRLSDQLRLQNPASVPDSGSEHEAASSASGWRGGVTGENQLDDEDL